MSWGRRLRYAVWCWLFGFAWDRASRIRAAQFLRYAGAAGHRAELPTGRKTFSYVVSDNGLVARTVNGEPVRTPRLSARSARGRSYRVAFEALLDK